VLCGRGLNEGDLCEEPHGYLELIPSAAFSPTMEHFMAVDPLWLDIQCVRLWPAYCDEKHHGSCHGLSEWETIDPAPSIILIDVDRQHLVQLTQPEKYVTLSYVWGKLPNVLETTKKNFLQLQQTGALDSQPWASRLPLTVRDAIYFTKLMGERYLWVDRLCIIQDDNEQKAVQLSWMSSIYANSYFTIVAADGSDANYGLRGVCINSSPRSYNPSILHFSSTCSMMAAPKFETQFNMEAWHKRGWTYQERTLSKRNLVFFQGKVFWECRKSVWTEDVADAPHGVSLSESSKRKSDRYSFELLRWPDLHQYSRLVSSYNNRLLTYQSDALQAFSAIINVLSRSFPGGLFYGIPELYFDFGLLWRSNTPSRRRSDEFPSWSWVGWEGNVVFSCLKKSHQLVWDNESFGPPIDIYPMVVWHKKIRETAEKFQIDNSYYDFQKMRKDPSVPLPPGWSRVKPSNLRFKAPGCANNLWVFRHADVPYKDFVHPIPMPPKPLAPSPDMWDKHLIFRTTRCFLFSGALLDAIPQRSAWSNISNDFVPYCLSFLLIDASGQWAGMIYSNSSDPKEVVLGERCEVIIISAGTAHIDENESVKSWLEEWKCVDDIKDKNVYEFYNVLLIQRKGEIAYRKALGRVWKDAWQRHPVEEIEVILG
jgi:hypothetical protein